MDSSYFSKVARQSLVVSFGISSCAVVAGLLWSVISGTPLVYQKFIAFWIAFSLMVACGMLTPLRLGTSIRPSLLFPGYSSQEQRRMTTLFSVVMIGLTFLMLLAVAQVLEWDPSSGPFA